MSTYNKAIVCGYLGRDAELKYTQGGEAVATLSLATSFIWNDKSGKKNEKTEWHRIVVWGKTAETLAEYLVKGKLVLVEGRLETRKWTDKNQIERYTTEIRGDRIVLLSSGKGGGVPHPAETTKDAAEQAQPVTVPEDDEIPF